MARPGYLLGLDLGLSTATAAIRCPPGPARPVALGPAGSVPSIVALGADGSVLVGEAAQRRALTDPAEVLRDVSRRIGDPVPLVAAGRTLSAATAVGLLLTRLVDAVTERQDAVPERVVLAHPGGWTTGEVGSVLTAVRGAMTPVPAPVAVVATRGRSDGVVAVVDLDTDLTASVVRSTGPGCAVPLGPSAVVPHLAGPPVEDAVLAFVCRTLGSAWPRFDPDDVAARGAVAELRRRCGRAMVTLSTLPAVEIDVDLPGLRTRVRLDRASASELVQPIAGETAEALGEALDSAGTGLARVDEVVLTGDGARFAVVAEVVAAALGRPVAVAPRSAAAVGAVLLDPDRRAPVAARTARPTPGHRATTARPAAPGAPVTVPWPRRTPAGARHRKPVVERPGIRAAMLAASTAPAVGAGRLREE